MSATAECNSVCMCVYTYKFPYIYHTNDGSTEADMCWKLITMNNNIYNKTGNERT
jgi:hypothetical protein